MSKGGTGTGSGFTCTPLCRISCRAALKLQNLLSSCTEVCCGNVGVAAVVGAVTDETGGGAGSDEESGGAGSDELVNGEERCIWYGD